LEAFLALPVPRSSAGSMPLRLFAHLHRLQPQRARFSSSPLAPRQNEPAERYLKELGLPSSANLVVVERRFFGLFLRRRLSADELSPYPFR
jgi:hypothetical protein